MTVKELRTMLFGVEEGARVTVCPAGGNIMDGIDIEDVVAVSRLSISDKTDTLGVVLRASDVF